MNAEKMTVNALNMHMERTKKTIIYIQVQHMEAIHKTCQVAAANRLSIVY